MRKIFVLTASVAAILLISGCEKSEVTGQNIASGKQDRLVAKVNEIAPDLAELLGDAKLLAGDYAEKAGATATRIYDTLKNKTAEAMVPLDDILDNAAVTWTEAKEAFTRSWSNLSEATQTSGYGITGAGLGETSQKLQKYTDRLTNPKPLVSDSAMKQLYEAGDYSPGRFHGNATEAASKAVQEALRPGLDAAGNGTDLAKKAMEAVHDPEAAVGEALEAMKEKGADMAVDAAETVAKEAARKVIPLPSAMTDRAVEAGAGALRNMIGSGR
ncbi:hypothetical protein [Nitratireductor basaltis]|uniref:Lipoprotein n=1 Tax=Nitratireductor basaltis TaxID=472175 RepID=A0A084UDQ8_9HYPH|nr:hypothetical protein [Nitratireductor basaltis]KFB11094.1 hypothetical protein EL18_02137 [Nitratireductor basaltis]